MATLDDYLGTLVSNLSQARVLADLASARIAEAYAGNDLLKHFPVPRMKIEDVELTIPVAIEGMAKKEKKDIPPPDAKKLASYISVAIREAWKLKSLPLDISSSFRSDIASHASNMIADIQKEDREDLSEEYVEDILTLTDKYFKLLVEKGILKSWDPKERIDLAGNLTGIIQRLQSQIRHDAGNDQLEHLNVTVETDKLKEKNPATLVIIKMKISEESMEWEKIDGGDGKIIHKLMPA